MFVYVLDINGNPLMPTKRFGKVRRLLISGKAKVVGRCPFTIKLLYETDTSTVQEVVLGQDTGSKHIGTACVAGGKVLYQSHVELRTDIKSYMDRRRLFRKFRRNRKTRYRKSRFLNRRNSIKPNRIPPSVKHKIQSHIDEIEFCKRILPVSKIVLEVSKFDVDFMKTSELLHEKIRGWGYNENFNYGFSSKRLNILHRDNYKCQCCGKKNTRLEVHHILYVCHGGTDREDNLITLCESCHKKIHDNKLILNKKPKKMNLRYATHMNIIRNQLLNSYKNAIETFGFVTKENRIHLDLPKDHYIDACVIASGGNPFICNDDIFYKQRVSKGDYKLTLGSNGKCPIPIGKIQGFRKFDKVEYLGKEYFIKGKFSSGYAILMDIFSNKIDFNHMSRGYKTPKMSNLKRISSRKTVLCSRQKSVINTI